MEINNAIQNLENERSEFIKKYSDPVGMLPSSWMILCLGNIENRINLLLEMDGKEIRY